MRRIIAVGVFVVLLLPLAASAQSLEGLWKAVEIVNSGGASEGRHTTDIQPGLLFFTGSHYSTMFVRGWEPRPMVPDDPTDEDRGKAYGPFTANAGTYALAGAAITFTPTVAKNPGTMTDNSYTRDVEWNGDALWLSTETNGGWTNRVRYERVE